MANGRALRSEYGVAKGWAIRMDNATDGIKSVDRQQAFKIPKWPGILMLVLAVVAIIVLVWIWIVIDRSRSVLGAIGGVIGFVGVFPLTYLAYLGFREEAQRKRLRDDFRLLGLVSEDDLEDTVENLYQTVYNPTQFLVYISLIVVFSLLLIGGYLSRANIAGIEPEHLGLAFFSFLGAYIFSVQELIRRYKTFDLQPQVYSSIFMRMVVAVVITFVGASVIQLAGGEIAGNPAGGSPAPAAWAAVLAFVIGIFPQRGIRWFVQRTNTILNTPTDVSNERPLEYIIGVSTWHQARLAEMGIDDAQNLATADIRELLLTTRFDTQEIIHWIDQAILFVKVGKKIDRFRDVKIMTFHELRMVVYDLSLDPLEKLEEDGLQQRLEARKRLVAVLGLSDQEELERLADYSNYPNYAYISEYYSRSATVARQRANLAMEILVGALEETDYQRAVDDGNRLLQQNPNDPALLYRLGTAYYHLGRLEDAHRAYSAAIKLDSRLAEAYYSRSMIYIAEDDNEAAIRDCTEAINIDRSHAKAFNNRGLAYINKGYFDRALEDLNKAIELDDRLGVAYFNRGFVYNARGNFHEAAIEFEKAYLLGYRVADLWVSWGNSLIGLERYEEAVDKLSQAVLYEADLASAYAKRGYAYFLLGREYYYQARIDLQTAIEKNPAMLSAHTNLGLLESKDGNFEAAINHYQDALELYENNYVTRYNLGNTYLQMGDRLAAVAEFQIVAAQAPPDTFEAVQTAAFLRSLPAEASNGAGSDGQPSRQAAGAPPDTRTVMNNPVTEDDAREAKSNEGE